MFFFLLHTLITVSYALGRPPPECGPAVASRVSRRGYIRCGTCPTSEARLHATPRRPSATPGGTPGGEGRVPGDSNMDGVFDSSDFVFVLQIGEYEDGIDGNSSFSEGDWNGDSTFGSGDLVVAFTDGGYEAGSRAAIAAVPEPSSCILFGLGMLLVLKRRRR